MNSAHTFQRVGAYVVDIFLISIVLVIFTFWLPRSDKVIKAEKEQEELINDFSNKKINTSEYIDNMNELSYTIDKERIPESLITVVLTLGYFATFAFYYKGQTLGKKLLHIKVVSNNNKELTHTRLIIRSLLFNGGIATLISVLVLSFIKSNQYSYTVGIINIIQSIFILVSILIVIFGKEKRGLHDYICKTKVVEE